MENISEGKILEVLSQKEAREVIFAVQECIKLFPKNKGKIYLTNILGYFVNEANHKVLIDNFGHVPGFTLETLNVILTKLSEIKVLTIVSGKQSAKYVLFNSYFYNKYIEIVNQSEKRTVNLENIKHIGFAIEEVNKQFPNNKGKIYLSNILGYFVNKSNHSKILSSLGCIPNYSKEYVSSVVFKMQEEKLLKVFVGNQGATKVILFANRFHQFIDSTNKSFTQNDYYKIIYICLQVIEQFPNNKNNVYVSNVLGYLVNKKNHDQFCKIFDSIPSYSQNDVEILFNFIITNKLGRKVIGNRGATHLQIFVERCKLYLEQMSKSEPVVKKSFSQRDYFIIIYICLQVLEQFPNNKNNVYISNVLGYLVNEKNHKPFCDIFETLPNYNQDDVEQLFNFIITNKLGRKVIGNRGATHIQLFIKRCKLYLEQMNKPEPVAKKSFTQRDYFTIIYICLQVLEQFPNNKNNVYVSNVLGYLVNEKNHKPFLKIFDALPNYNQDDIEQLFDFIIANKLGRKVIGNRGATHIQLFIDRCKEYLKQMDKDVVDKDAEAVIFAIKCLDKQYPNNKGKVYVSNIHAFFRIDSNVPNIEKELGFAPRYEKSEIENIVQKLDEEKIIKKFEGNRGATYVKLLKQKSRDEFTIDDLKAVLFAVKTLDDQYPKNKGKVYVSNISAFFKTSANLPKIFEALQSNPTYSKDEIESIVNKLSEQRYLFKYEGKRSATYVMLNKRKYNELMGPPPATEEDKINLISKVLFIMNGRCYPMTMYDILLNDKSPLIGKENNLEWLNEYFPNRNIVSSEDEINDLLEKMFDEGLIEVFGNYIKLSINGIKKVKTMF